MKKILVFTLLAMCSVVSVANDKILGQWTTIDDSTNKPKSIVNIYEKDGKYFGKIERLFRKETEDQNPKCDKCKGDDNGKEIIGLEILKDFKAVSETKLEDGKITDPSNGKVYSCKIELIENGEKLKVRGFVGISLLGRTQVWQRKK